MGQFCCTENCTGWLWESIFHGTSNDDHVFLDVGLRGGQEGDLHQDTGLGLIRHEEDGRGHPQGMFISSRNYDVFLNHGGPDVKRRFVDHLYASLETAGIHCFVEYKEIRVGEDPWDAIKSTVHHTKVHIAVFSPGYADSKWCLNELCEMLECYSEGTSDLFLPVFYNVTPSDLCSVTAEGSCYFPAFVELRRYHKPSVIEKWEKALCKASVISGWTIDAASGFQARLVRLIVSEVLNVLNRTRLEVAKHPVGVNEKLRQALNLMQIDTVRKGVHTLGIFGMGGLGKTTVAKAIYNGIYREFESVSFLHNVRSEAKGLTGLRGMLEHMLRALLKTDAISVDSTAHGKQIMKDRLRGVKVLIILDDVDELEQLAELLPPHDCHLKDGSQIVVTTRDEQIVRWAQVQESLLMEGLNQPHALLLFSHYAFPGGQKEPSEAFKQLANRVVQACQGLPLALEVLGSRLHGKDIFYWEASVNALECQWPTILRDVTSVLKISFDALGNSEEKLMFLDIACFLLGAHEDRVKRIWRDSDAAELCLHRLKSKCLVELDQNRRLIMHDLLRDMGREIVENSHANIWQRSHLWNEKDARFVLRSKKGTSNVRGLGLALDDHKVLDTTSFAGMSALQLLVLSNVDLTGDFALMPKELRWFQWRYCLLESLPSELALENVAVLDLMGSKITRFWGDHTFQNLRELNLSGCANLKELPEMSSCFSGLEMLDLGGCVSLETIPDSIDCLGSSLRYLNVSNCRKLIDLPDGIARLQSLNTLLMNNCTKLTWLPEAIGQLTALREIGLDGVSLRLFPESFGDLSNLISLQLNFCSELFALPSTIGNLRKLSSLVINSCPHINGIPQGVSKLTDLVHFEVAHCELIHWLPVNVGNLQKLVTFNLAHCNIENGGLPNQYSTLSSLKTLFLEYNPISRLPSDFGLLPNLQSLQLHHCPNLWKISYLPITLTFLDLGDCPNLERIPCLFSLKELRELVLCNCTGLLELTGLQCLRSLSNLNISGCTSLGRVPDGLENLTMLKSLYLAGSGVSLLQDNEPWVQKLISLELVSLYGSKVPDCFLSCKKENANNYCVEVAVQEGDTPCKGVLCCFVSHDKGWSHYPWDHGRYSSSYSSMEIEVFEGSDMRTPRYTQTLFVNRHADRRNQLHISIFGASHPLVASLRGGSTIVIIVDSRFKGWAITVNEAAVKLMYGENEMQETLMELSRQAKNFEDLISVKLRDWNVNQGGLSNQSPPLSSLPYLVRYDDVFLNTGGPDVKRYFMDILHESLKIHGLVCFVDYVEPRVGEHAWDAIVSAIHHSRVHIVVFSPGYADSSWCLNELCEMLECHSTGSLFFPVFCNVSPRDLRATSDPMSCYFSAFVKLCRYHKPVVVKKWRKALYEASMIKGWTLDVTSGFETRGLVRLIVSEVLIVLNRGSQARSARESAVARSLSSQAFHLMPIDTPGKGVNKIHNTRMSNIKDDLYMV